MTYVNIKGKFPKNINNILIEYWDALLNSYEDVLTEFFPYIKDELSNHNDFNTVIIIPSIKKENNICSGWFKIWKLKSNDGSKDFKIIIDKRNDNIKFKKDLVYYKKKKYIQYKPDRMVFSDLTIEMPIRNGVYKLLINHLGRYFNQANKENK
jgi:hypothetical protein